MQKSAPEVPWSSHTLLSACGKAGGRLASRQLQVIEFPVTRLEDGDLITAEPGLLEGNLRSSRKPSQDKRVSMLLGRDFKWDFRPGNTAARFSVRTSCRERRPA